MATMAGQIGSLLYDDKFADLEIRCKGKSFKAHRMIVCLRSPVLDKECSTGSEDANPRSIEISAFDADTVERMLQFIYRGAYTNKPAPEDAIPSTSILEQHVQTYCIGDHYELPDLKDLAVKNFRADRPSLLPINVEALVRMIEQIYDNTPSLDEYLRNEILSFCIDEKKVLLDDAAFILRIVQHPRLQLFTAAFIIALDQTQQQDLDGEQKSHAETVKSLEADTKDLTKQLDAFRTKVTKELSSAKQEVTTARAEAAFARQQTTSAKDEATSTKLQLADAQKSMDRYKKEAERLSRELQKAQASAAKGQNSATSRIGEQILAFESIDECRHCGEDFNGNYYLDDDDVWGSGFVARCDDCTTRHYHRL